MELIKFSALFAVTAVSKIDGSSDVNGKSNSKDQMPISVQDLIGALNFPKDETDSEGFRKLRIALADSETGQVPMVVAPGHRVSCFICLAVDFAPFSCWPHVCRLWRHVHQRGFALALLDRGYQLNPVGYCRCRASLGRDGNHHASAQGVGVW